MQKTACYIVVLSIFVLGCQTFNSSPRLATTQAGTSYSLRGQAPIVDPFALAQANASSVSAPVINPFTSVQQDGIYPGTADQNIEKERIKALATAHRDDAPDYLKPLRAWNGPFEHRLRQNTQGQDYELFSGHNMSEQNIIRQAGYEQVSERINSEKNNSGDSGFDWDSDETQKGFDWSSLAPEKSYNKARDWAGLGPDEQKANELLEKGRNMVRSNPDLSDKRKNIESAKIFADAAKKYPDSLIEEDALHLAAECYYFADDYMNAFTKYQKLVIKYQHSKYIDNAVRRLFRIGRYWESVAEGKGDAWHFNFTNKSLPKYDTFGYAKKAYETIFIYDPTGPIADSALMALANAYLRKGRYQGDDNYDHAAYYYQLLREEHPLSKFVVKAYQNELYARTQAYMGADYPGKTLVEAKKLADVMLRQFGSELDSEDKENILKIKEDIITKEAERLWKEGQFFDLKKQEYGAARLKYGMLIDDYPQTEYADKAKKRMEQIEGLRDTPSLFSMPVNPFKMVR